MSLVSPPPHPRPARSFSVGACASSPARRPEAHDREATASLAMRAGVFAYGLVCYAIFFATFLYAFGFVAGVGTPTALDRLPPDGLMSWPLALGINLVLLAFFAIQHSVMARPWFKVWWTGIVPEPAERSTYVLLSSIALLALFAGWQPLGGMIWRAEEPTLRGALYALMAAGWLLVLVTTFLINHFDLFGLRHVWLFLRGKPYTHLPFKTPILYQSVRHPLYVGWLIAFWATPTMTTAHFVFALVTTLYILAAIGWEERDLIELYGQRYVEYRRRVPMLVPRLRSTEQLANDSMRSDT